MKTGRGKEKTIRDSKIIGKKLGMRDKDTKMIREPGKDWEKQERRGKTD